MSDLIDNERTKLLANALDRASTACLPIGILTPIAGYLYGILNLGPAIQQKWPAFTMVGWLVATVALHFIARQILKGLKP